MGTVTVRACTHPRTHARTRTHGCTGKGTTQKGTSDGVTPQLHGCLVTPWSRVKRIWT